MSPTRSEVDLSVLARRAEPIARPRRGWLRIVLPLGIVLAFLWVLRGTLVEWLRPRPAVTVVRPTRIEGAPAAPGAAQAAGAAPRLAVQAAGWVEPDPFPVFAAALAGGVLVQVLVQESDSVTAGQPVALLVADDARLQHEQALATHALAVAALAGGRARAEIAAERFDAAVEVREALRSARARTQGREADAERRAAALREGEAQVALAESEILVQRELEASGASGARQVEIAVAELAVAEARLAGLRGTAALAVADLEESRAALERAERDLELRFADRLERDVSEAEVERLEAEVAHADATLAEAALRLSRMAVLAPSDGVVLERLAATGESLASGAPVCSLYDPTALRIRVDVPQSDVEKLFIGQAAEVLADSRPGRPYRGEVLRIVQRADIQKVTLEAQVRVLDADGLLRPDMLTQVRCLDARADGRTTATDAGAPEARATSAAPRIAIPARLVVAGAVWVFDPVASVARRRPVEVGAPYGEPDALREVLAGLNLTDKVIDRGRVELDALGDRPAGVPVRVEAPPGDGSGARGPTQ